jgi:hypothetical protein
MQSVSAARDVVESLNGLLTSFTISTIFVTWNKLEKLFSLVELIRSRLKAFFHLCLMMLSWVSLNWFTIKIFHWFFKDFHNKIYFSSLPRIGLCGFDNPLRDPKTEELKRHIGQVSKPSSSMCNLWCNRVCR